MKRAVVIGVMGAGEGATRRDKAEALIIGRTIARSGWVLLSGGRDVGVMASANAGARKEGGLTVGLQPGDRRETSPDVVLHLPTGLGSARNNVNVLASDVVVALGYQMGPGTVSEVALAIKASRTVILVSDNQVTRAFFEQLLPERIHFADNAAKALPILTAAVAKALGEDELLRIRVD